MADPHFVDRLREASIDVSKLPMDSLKEAADGLTGAVSTDDLPNLVRFVYGQETPSKFESWIRETCRSRDAAFPLRGEDLLVRIIAAQALIDSLNDGSTDSSLAALVVRSAGYLGWSPVHEDVPKIATDALYRRSRSRFETGGIPRAPQRAKTVGQALDALAQQADWNLMSSAIREVAEEVTQVKKFAGAVAAFSASHTKQTRERISILWWLLSGWSTLLDAPFPAIPERFKAPILGVELADLVTALPGPISELRALLEQALKLGESDAAKGEIPKSSAPVLSPPPSEIVDFCPVLSSPESKSDQRPIAVAEQAYVERLMIKVWEERNQG